jgi:hypothetical protein
MLYKLGLKMKKVIVGLGVSLSLLACPPAQTRCDVPVMLPDSGMEIVDSGMVDSGIQAVDAGSRDAGSSAQESTRYVNSTSQTLVFLEEDDAGVEVEPFSSVQVTRPPRFRKFFRIVQNGLPGEETRLVGPFEILPDDRANEGDPRVLSSVVVAHESSSSDGVTLRKGWDGSVKGSGRPQKTFSERITESLEASAAALDIGIDMTGDCKADVGARKGMDTKFAVFTEDTAPVCATEGVLAFRVHSSINGDEVEDINFVNDGDQPTLAYRLKVWQLMQGQTGVQIMRLGAPVPDVFVMHVRTTGVNEDYSFNGNMLASGVQPGRVAQLPIPMAYRVLKTRTKSNQTNERIAVGGTMLPLVGEVGPCKPPYLCDFSKQVNGKHWAKVTLRTSHLLVISDTKATLVDLPDVADAAARTNDPFLIPIVIGPNASRTSVCVGNDTTCTTRDGISADVNETEISSMIMQPARSLPVFRDGVTTRPQFRVTEQPSAAGTPAINYISAPRVMPSSSSILVVAPAQVFDASAMPDAKIVIQVSASAKKNYVGHVTLIKQ